MFCKNCGSELKEGATVCAVCGTEVKAIGEAGIVPETGTNGSTPGGEPVNTPAGMVPGASAGTSESASTGAADSAQTGAKKLHRKGRKKWIALAAVAAVAVIAGICCLLYFTGDAYKCKKAMKLADDCLKEKEYSDALEYYDEALDLDETQWEAYLGSAECYLEQEKYNDALKLLKKGIKEAKGEKDEDVAEAFLKDVAVKQEEAYVLGVDTLVEKADYSGAYSLLNEGIEETGSDVLEKKRSEVYSAEAEHYLEQSDYDSALAVLAQGYEVTQDTVLAEERSQVYLALARENMAQGAYDSALVVLTEGYEATQDNALLKEKSQVYLTLARENMAQGAYDLALAILAEGYEATQDNALLEEKGQVYLAWSDAYLQSDVLTAVQILESGIEATGSEELAARKEYVEANVSVAKVTRYDFSGNLMEVEEYSPEGLLLQDTLYDSGYLNLRWEYTYDEAGNELSGTQYDSDGDVAGWYEYTYGGNGKVQSKAFYCTDWIGRTYVFEEYTYDEAGRERSYAYYDSKSLLGEQIYDEYGKIVKDYWSDGMEIESDSEITYEYDDAGHFLKGTWYDTVSDSVWRIEEYTCDESGHVLRVTRDGVLYEEYTYDASGNVLSATQYGYGSNDSWEKTYDSFGNVVSLKKSEEYYYSDMGYDLGLISRHDAYGYDRSCTWTYEYVYTGL